MSYALSPAYRAVIAPRSDLGALPNEQKLALVTGAHGVLMGASFGNGIAPGGKGAVIGGVLGGAWLGLVAYFAAKE